MWWAYAWVHGARWDGDRKDAMLVQRRPMTALRVSDLEASVRFYEGQIGCTLVERHEGGGAVTVEHVGFQFVLFVGDAGAALPADLCDPACEVLLPLATVFLNGGASNEIQALRDSLLARGVAQATVVERWWGDHLLDTSDPDGYRVRFWTTTERSADETLALYERGVATLERALDGLSDADLDRSAGSGEWTIRQIVHHLADSEAAMLQRTMAALAEPGRVWTANLYAQDAWVSGLDHAGRDIGPSLALLRAVRGYLSHLVRHMPDAWQRATIGPAGQALTVGTTISMLMSHANEHMVDIERLAGAKDMPCGY